MNPEQIATLRAGGHSALAHKYNDLDSCPVCHADKREEACGEDHIIGTKPESCFACLSEQRDELLSALRSIANNSCCGTCQEAALFARSAIAKVEGGRTEALPAQADIGGRVQAQDGAQDSSACTTKADKKTTDQIGTRSLLRSPQEDEKQR